MKILKNLLGENAKIHGDSIFLESGSNDDGVWVRLPDGTQKCWHEISFAPGEPAVNSRSEKTWNFPRSFGREPVVIPNPETATSFSAIASNYKANTRIVNSTRAYIILTHLGINNDTGLNRVVLFATGR